MRLNSAPRVIYMKIIIQGFTAMPRKFTLKSTKRHLSTRGDDKELVPVDDTVEPDELVVSLPLSAYTNSVANSTTSLASRLRATTGGLPDGEFL